MTLHIRTSRVLRSVPLMLICAVAVLCASTSGRAADDSPVQEQSTAERIESTFQKDRTDVAIDKAIAYIIGQQRDDGAICDKQNDTTMTSLAVMAMAGVGIQPPDPSPEGRAMQKALAFVLRDDRQDPQGYFGQKDGSRMYGHGITTLMLTEMLGMGVDREQDRLIHERCQKAVNLILSSQKHPKSHKFRGGWRYAPNSSDADLSATVWQLMALRSAKNDGLDVPASAIHQAIEYLQRSYASTLDRNGMPDNKASGFCYTPGQNSPTYTMTSAGLLAMQVCGEYESPLVAGAADWLLKHPPKWKERFFFYGTYYYAQGMYQRGGEHANTARTLVQEILLEEQDSDGSWLAVNSSESRVGRVYATSMAVLSLSVKYHYLPIYQK